MCLSVCMSYFLFETEKEIQSTCFICLDERAKVSSGVSASRSSTILLALVDQRYCPQEECGGLFTWIK